MANDAFSVSRVHRLADALLVIDACETAQSHAMQDTKMKIATLLCLCVLSAKAQVNQTLEVTQNSDITGKTFIQTATDSAHPCIHVHAGGTATIRFCTIHTMGWGIVADDGATVTVDNCELSYFGAPQGANYLPQPLPTSAWQSAEWVAKSTFLLYATKPAMLSVTHCRFSGNATGGVKVVGDPNTGTNAYIYTAYNDFIDPWNAIQYAGVRDGNAWIYYNRILNGPSVYHTDQINVFQSSFVTIYGNFILGNPDAPLVVNSANIQAGDYEDNNITVANNVIVNGHQTGISVFYGWGQTAVNNNTVIGIGYNHDYPYGMGGQGSQYATYAGNAVGWWSPMAKSLVNYLGVPTNVNTSLGASSITLAAEEAQYGQWLNTMVQSGVYIGPWYAEAPEPHYPQAADFAGVGQ